MTKHQAVEELINNKDCVRICKRIGVREDLVEDLCQEVYLVLLEYNDDVIVQAYEKKQLGFFAMRILTNMYMSKNTSPFTRKFRHHDNTITYMPPMTGRHHLDEDEKTFTLPEYKRQEIIRWSDRGVFVNAHQEESEENFIDAEQKLKEIKTLLIKMETESSNGWYRANLFKMYLEKGDAWQVHKITEIPYKSVCNAINDVKKYLKRELYGNI